MCLNSIISHDPKQVKYAYKVFEKNPYNNLYKGMYYGLNNYELNTWYERDYKAKKLETWYCREYCCGFHCYLNKKDAIIQCILRDEAVVQVEVFNVTTIGKQCKHNIGNTIVCDKIKLIKEIYLRLIDKKI